MDFAPVSKKIVAFGSKQVFLPKFTVALIRTPNLSPYHAKFRVPLNFSKYDLRDYLYHAYNVKVHSIRSLVKQLPVRDTVKQPRHWFRPENEKYMTVEMEKPFVWPETPESWEAWGRKEKQDGVLNSRAYQGVKSAQDQRIDQKTLRHEALNLLRKEPASEAKEKKKDGKEKTIENAARKSTKPKKLDENVLRRWEEQRTPQILGHELLDSKNWDRLRPQKSTPFGEKNVPIV
ncbi:mitochondrial 54S ribosomal protein YmL41 [Didymosphaeria variabile]|uniref:Large ribosomal subunit protein uL23m n=1 Tax=Didymosphaeria variabile TaxID=1932322 RepID=A0A9W8XKS1_9PLEO|nr:mitochondrial 54S ribosomal protein YmL41 [Didymosphaeria variabile]KAJ4353294.1 mitochondrial 54S ribosomal protein YmL41 [Didymosphaeria variabile]